MNHGRIASFSSRAFGVLAIALLLTGLITLPAVGLRTHGNEGTGDAAGDAASVTLEQEVLIFSNSGPITIPFGAANPYPSVVSATWCTVTITDVNVSLHGFGHAAPNDIDVVLRGPTGQSSMIMSDVGASGGVEDVDLFLDDEAGTDLPTATSLSTGTFRPTDCDTACAADLGGDTMPPPAPSPTTAALSVFDGTSPVGNWEVFVVDDFSNVNNGDFEGGWGLRLEVTPETCPVAVKGGRVKEGKKRAFTLTRTGPLDGSLTAAYATKRGSASGKDFKSTSGDLTFAPGEATKKVVVKTRDDRMDERKERFFLVVIAGAGTFRGRATIKDND